VAVFKRQAGRVAPYQGQSGVLLPGAAEHAGGAVEAHGPEPVVPPQVVNRSPDPAAEVGHARAGWQGAIG
jgi:hypothetical protein